MTRKTTLLLLALAASGAITGDVIAQSERAGIVTVATGTVTVARPATPRAPLRFRDDVYVHDRIATAEHSLARILLGGKAVVTVSERSVITVTEVPGRSTIHLSAGRISLAVARERMAPGDVVEIRTPVAIAGVRGTVVVAEILPGDSASSRFTVLKGVVDVAALDGAGRVVPGATPLRMRETLTADTHGISPARAITPESAARLGAEFRAPLPPPSASVVAAAAAVPARQTLDYARRTLGPAVVDAAARDAAKGSTPTAGDAPATDAPKADTPKTDAPTVEAAKPEVSRADAAKADGPKVDAPKADITKADLPKVESPKVEAPKVDITKADLPKVESPRVDAPKVDLPKVDIPKVDAAKVDLPKVDVPKVDAPKMVDTPKLGVPKLDVPRADIPAAGSKAIEALKGTKKDR